MKKMITSHEVKGRENNLCIPGIQKDTGRRVGRKKRMSFITAHTQKNHNIHLV